VCHLLTNIMDSIGSRCLHYKNMPGVSLRKKDRAWKLKQSCREAIKLNIDKKIIQKGLELYFGHSVRI